MKRCFTLLGTVVFFRGGVFLYVVNFTVLSCVVGRWMGAHLRMCKLT